MRRRAAMRWRARAVSGVRSGLREARGLRRPDRTQAVCQSFDAAVGWRRSWRRKPRRRAVSRAARHVPPPRRDRRHGARIFRACRTDGGRSHRSVCKRPAFPVSYLASIRPAAPPAASSPRGRAAAPRCARRVDGVSSSRKSSPVHVIASPEPPWRVHKLTQVQDVAPGRVDVDQATSSGGMTVVAR